MRKAGEPAPAVVYVGGGGVLHIRYGLAVREAEWHVRTRRDLRSASPVLCYSSRAVPEGGVVI